MSDQTIHFFRLIRDFLLTYLPKQKGASSNTINSYKKALNKFLDYMCKKLEIPLNSLSFEHSSREILEQFLDYMESEYKWTTATRNQRLSAIRRFYRYSAERDPSLTACYQELMLIPIKKNPAKEIDFFSEAALEEILKMPDLSKKKGLRDLVFMIFLYDTAARIQEVLDVKLEDFKVNQKQVTLHGKGNKIRIVPLMQKTVEHLQNYIKIFHQNSHSEDYLFYIKHQGEKTQMSQDNASKFIAEYGAMAAVNNIEVPQHLYPHMFRHSRAMHLYRNGMPLPLLSEFLGHEQMETTIHFYANANIKMKQEAIEKATCDINPLLTSKSDYIVTDDDETLKKLYGLL